MPDTALLTISNSAQSTYLKALAEDHMPTTCAAYKAALRRWLRWCLAKEISPNEATRADVIRWRDERRAANVAAGSVELDLAALRTFYTWAIEQGMEIENPAEGVRVPGRRGPRSHKRNTLSADEVNRLLCSCDDSLRGRRDRALLCLMVYCAVRTIEAHRAELGDFERRDGRLLLWVWGKGRSGPDEFVVIPATAEEAMQAWLAERPGDGGPLFVSLSQKSYGRRLSLKAIREIVLTRFRRCGIHDPRTTCHSLRHTALTTAIENGATPMQAQAMMRHGDIRTTLKYFHEKGRLTDPAEDRIRYGQETT